MKAWTFVAGAAVALGGSSAVAASSDYYLKIEGIARPGNAGPIYLKVRSTGDLDGDGVPDTATLRLVCADGVLKSAHYSIKDPRDASIGQASGRERGITHADDWNPPAGKLAAMTLGYDLKNANAKGGRVSSAGGGWTAIELTNAADLCSTAEAAASVIKTKTKSNQSND
jgi:hypothetical protein